MQSETVPIKVTLLGTGTSTGIPVIGCHCRVCASTDPRDKRTRCACLVEAGSLSIVIDTGPDFRMQALRESMTRIDAVLFTHHHYDHIVGIDDLRPFFFTNDRPIPCYARPNVAQVIRTTFPYIFADGTYPGVSNLSMHEVTGPFLIHSRYSRSDSVAVNPVEVLHGDLRMFGYRIGRFAYLTDTSYIPEESMALLRDLDVLVLDALRHEQHQTHFSISEAVTIARRIGAAKTYFIHMTHSLLHREEDRKLPDGIFLAYDGLKIDVAL